jgi:O-antigen/teichoic acid export membrane protein
MKVLSNYSFHRAIVAGLSFGASVIGARLLSSDQFSALVTAAFVAKFLQITNFGAVSGYFVSRYSVAESSSTLSAAEEPRFILFFVAQLTVVGLVVLGVAMLWLPTYFLGAIAFLLLVPLFVIEPSLRYRRVFSFSLLPELILSMGLLAVSLIAAAGLTHDPGSGLYLWIVASLCGGVLALALARCSLRMFVGEKSTLGLLKYAKIVATGTPVYLGTALFVLASSADRLLFPLYGTDEQISIYFLAYQLCMGAMIFVTAINFVNTVNLGEARKNSEAFQGELVRKKLREALLVAVGSYSALSIGGVILEAYVLPNSFQGLTKIVLMLGLGLSVFFVSGAVTPIVGYFQRQIPLTLSMAIVAVVLFINNGLAYWQGFGPFWLASGTALALVIHGLFAIWHTFRVIEKLSTTN